MRFAGYGCLALTSLSLVSSSLSARHQTSKRQHSKNTLAERDIFATVAYLQDVVTFQVCNIGAQSFAVVALLTGRPNTGPVCVQPVNPNAPVAPVVLAASTTQIIPAVVATPQPAAVAPVAAAAPPPKVVTPSPAAVTTTPPPTTTTTTSTTSTKISTSTTSLVLGTATPITPSPGPHFLIYADLWTNGGAPPPSSNISGFTVFALAFYLVSGPTDMAQGWMLLDPSTRSSIKADYAAAGKKLIVAAFGSTDQPTTDGADPIRVANELAAFVIKYDLDGVDVDYEDFPAMGSSPPTAEKWLITFTIQLRSLLPSPKYIITHAPVAPWFSYNQAWAGGAYLYIDQQVGKYIDWYNVQFYNQGPNEYTNCTSLLTSAKMYPGSSLFEIAANGVILDKIIIGKPAIAADANDGFMPTAALRTCVSQAQQGGYQGGLALWQYPHQLSGYVAKAG